MLRILNNILMIYVTYLLWSVLIQWLHLQPAGDKWTQINPLQPDQKSSGCYRVTRMSPSTRLWTVSVSLKILSPGADCVWKGTLWSWLLPENQQGVQRIMKKKKNPATSIYFPHSVEMHKESYLSSKTIQGRSIAVNYCNSLFSSLSDHCRKGC